jgi:hypothetical protein
MGRFEVWDILYLGRFGAWDVLRLGSFWGLYILYLGRFGAGTFWGLGRFVYWTFWGLDILRLGPYVFGRSVFGRYVFGLFVYLYSYTMEVCQQSTSSSSLISQKLNGEQQIIVNKGKATCNCLQDIPKCIYICYTVLTMACSVSVANLSSKSLVNWRNSFLYIQNLCLLWRLQAYCSEKRKYYHLF